LELRLHDPFREEPRVRIIDFVSVEAGETGVHDLRATDAEGVVRELGGILAPLARPSPLEPDHLNALLLRREQVGSTAVGHEVAIPHARTSEVAATVGVIGVSQRGIDFGAPDGLPVRVFVAMVSPIHGGRHLHAIAAVARELGDPGLRRQLLRAADGADLHRLLGYPSHPRV
jgi:mannitol/fructose-specific phosphotransferase system IIA component (Ntr-type)